MLRARQLNSRFALTLTLSLPLALGLTGCDKGDGDGDGDGDATTALDTTGSEMGTEDTGDGDGDGDTGDGDGEASTGDGDGDGDQGACATDVGFGTPRLPGQPIAHMMGQLHDGTMFNTCETEGKPTVFDMSALWCGPCHSMAEYMSTGVGQYPNVMPIIKDWTDNNYINWVTILAQDSGGAPAQPSHVASWENMYPHEHIIVMTGDPTIEGYMIDDHWPTIHVGWSDYTWLSTDMGDYIQPLVDLYNAS